jgi:hypothetical protein
MTNVVDIEAERERRKLERYFNPSPARHAFDTALAIAVVIGAFWVGTWLLGPSEFKAWLAQQEWK